MGNDMRKGRKESISLHSKNWIEKLDRKTGSKNWIEKLDFFYQLMVEAAYSREGETLKPPHMERKRLLAAKSISYNAHQPCRGYIKARKQQLCIVVHPIFIQD
jgi:hypothetical protein